MKKIVWTFGLISGGIIALLMSVTIPFADQIGYGKAMILGYTTMVAAFLLVFFGIRSYRDNVGGGSVGFGRAFAVGALIALVSSACYVASWEVMYHAFMPDFMNKYAARQLEVAKEKGATQAELAAQAAELNKAVESYSNPVYNVAMTFMEPLPVGLLIALVSAGILSRRRRVGDPAPALT